MLKTLLANETAVILLQRPFALQRKSESLHWAHLWPIPGLRNPRSNQIPIQPLPEMTPQGYASFPQGAGNVAGINSGWAPVSTRHSFSHGLPLCPAAVSGGTARPVGSATPSAQAGAAGPGPASSNHSFLLLSPLGYSGSNFMSDSGLFHLRGKKKGWLETSGSGKLSISGIMLRCKSRLHALL